MWKNTYRLTGENNNLLKRKVNSSNLVKYIEHKGLSTPADGTAEPANDIADSANHRADRQRPDRRQRRDRADHSAETADRDDDIAHTAEDITEPAAKRAKFEDDLVFERSTAESRTYIVSPVCEAWQREKCTEFDLELIRPNGLHDGRRSRTLRADQRLKTSRIKGDGNCLFRAFSSVISGTQNNHDILRVLTVSYMLEHPEVFNSICDNVTQYIKQSRMASLGVWGTEIEIFALATMLDATVFVYSDCGMTSKWLPYRPLLESPNESHRDDVFIINLSHHFEPAAL